MAKDRTQVADLAGPAPLQPVSTPVDTYHTPIVARPRPVDAQLGDVAKALQDIQPSLARFNDTTMQLSKEEGAAIAAKNKVSFKDAVEKGLIKPGQNPWLAKGYKEQILSLQAQDYDSNLRQAWTKSGVSETDDPQAFKSFVDSFTHTYVDKMDLKTDSTFGQTFVPQMLKSQANLLQQHTEYRQERIVQQAKDATYRNIQSIIDSHYLFSDDAHIQAAIKQHADSMVANGLPGADVNKLMVDAIRDKAMQDEDATVLSLGRGISTGNGMLGQTQYAQEKFREAEDHIFAKSSEKASHEWATHEHQKKAIGENLMSQAAVRIGQNPLADLSDLTAAAEAADPEVAKSIRGYKDYVLTLGHKVYDDPEATANLYDDIYAGRASATQITSLARQGKLSPDKVPFALRDMEEAEKHRELLNDPSINRAIEEMGSAIAGGEFLATSEDKAKALEAKNLLRQGLLEYQKQHPNATRIEAYGEVMKNQAVILKGVGMGKSQLAPGTSKAVLGDAPKPTAAAPAAPAAKALYATTDDLKAALKEYNSTQGGGRLAIQAEALSMSIPEFIKAQSALLRKPAAKK